MSIKAVIFDLGGVLVRTEDRAPRTKLGLRFGKSYAEMDRVVFNKSSYRASIGEITSREHWQFVMHSLDLPESEIESFYDQFFGGDVVDYEIIKTITALRPQYTTALLSNAWDDLRQLMVKKWKIESAFNQIFISAEIGIAKPDERIYKFTLEKLGIAPEEAVFVDDFIENIEAARVLGMHGIHFKEPDAAMRELRDLLKN
ncbi:MAG: HAD family phosphatase [Anaerolineales bacterium]|uniref:HAD family phosphatase n=1 Tax=Candidatus Desulfolinea nitratireducens TaxID=2841698 RepID=A0A8J6TG41_9CHLR|nr:HAD family phosphatase [Candidatus Desulfolinea nitratireducens]MBL6961060.1 HAD family phosphatase [Anaerolineales bacterium]